ncbi:MAG: hypothetical protein QF535_09200, partial [Anaerolineales bacterium]|nr:hypothetical protein [Anaerolineales bacterium]
FFGATSGSYMLWDESADDLNLVASGLGVISAKDLGTGIHVKSSDTGGSAEASVAEELVLERNSHCGMTILSSTSTTGNINFGDSGDNNIGRIIYDHSDNNMSFTTNAATAMQIDSSGDVTVSTGNLVIGTSGKGIDFSATADSSGTMTSELLDDYEEGTWTPTLNNTGGTPSYTWQVGKYVKVGRHVWLTANVKFTVTPSGVTQQAVGGFPFANTSTAANYWAGIIDPYQGFNYSGDRLMVSVADGGTIAYVYQADATTGYNRSSFKASAIGTTIEFRFSINYPT